MENNVRTLAKNSGILVFASSSIKLLSFLLLPLYTRVLDTHDYGVTDTILELALLVVGAFSLCIDWGMTAFFYDKKEEDYYVKINTSCTVFCIVSAVLCLLTAVFSKYVSLILFHTSDYAWAVALGFLYASLKLSYFAFRVCSRMRGDLKSVAIYSLAELGVLLLMNILLILVFKVGYIAILYANVASQIACGALYLFGNRKYIKFKTYDNVLLKRVLKYCAPLTPTVLLTWINSFADRYFIGQFHDQGQVGLYGRAFQMVTLLSVLTTAFLSAYPSFAYSNASDKEKRPQYAIIYDAMVAILAVLGVFITLFSREIFKVMTAPNYHEAYIAVGLLSFGHIFYTLGNLMGYGITIQKNGKLYLLVNLSGAVCNIILNFLLVPKFGYVGAAFTTCVAQILSMVLSRYFAEKKFKCNYRFYKSLIVILTLLVLSYLIGELHILIKIPVFVLLIIFVLFIYKSRIPQIKQLLKVSSKKRNKTSIEGENL